LKENILKAEKNKHLLNTQKSGSAITGIYCAIEFNSHLYTHYDTFFNYTMSFFFPQDPSFIHCTMFSEYSSCSMFLFILMLYLLHILWTLHWIQSYLLPHGYCAGVLKSSISVYYKD